MDETEANKTGEISITTRTTRAMFERVAGRLYSQDIYHERAQLVVVLRRNNYQLCTFMMMDEHGNGQVVQ